MTVAAPTPTLLGLAPGGPVTGSFRAPGSKAIAQRLLVAGALAEGELVVRGLPAGEDVQHALLAADRMRAQRRSGTARLRVDAGESGTLARLTTAALALSAGAGTEVEVTARGSLLARSSPALFRALESVGVRLARPAAAAPGGWPVRLNSVAPPHGIVLESPGSSQEASALCMALAAAGDRRWLELRGEVPSRPYLDLTLSVLERFGVHVRREGARGNQRIALRGPLRAPAEPVEIEADASSAAVLAAAACLSLAPSATSAGSAGASTGFRLAGLPAASRQPDALAMPGVLAAFGCWARREEHALVCSAGPWRAAHVDLSPSPDLVPLAVALAVRAASAAGHVSLIDGLGSLRGKESDRIAVLAEGIRRIGLTARAGDDFIEVGPARGPIASEGPVVLDPRGDHRMAFAFALFGLVRPGVLVSHPGCVAKSWPAFWDDLKGLGFRVEAG